MTGFQKFIKYAAIAFGIYLSVTIVFVFLGIAKGLVISSQEEIKKDEITDSEFRDILEGTENENKKTITKEYENIKKLEIDLENINLDIRKGENFKVEGTNIPDNIRIQQNGENVKIDDENIATNFFNENSLITIYIPESEKLDEVDIEAQYAEVEIEKIYTAKLNLDLYNNTCKINEIVADYAKISNEYADLDIDTGEIKSFQFESEYGSENVTVKVSENAKIDLENTDAEINFIGKQEDYQIYSQKIAGNLYVEDQELVSGNETIGNGNIKIDLKMEYTDANIYFQEMNENRL